MRPRQVAKDSGHLRTKAVYADDNQESSVDGTGAPGRDQDLRRLALTQEQSWRSPKLGSGLGGSEEGALLHTAEYH